MGVSVALSEGVGTLTLGFVAGALLTLAVVWLVLLRG